MEDDTFLTLARKAKEESGRWVASQLLELCILRAGPARLGMDDYYFYRLYRNSLTLKQKLGFIGWRRNAQIDKALNDNKWRVYANDKLQFSQKMAEAGLSTPEFLALFLHSPPTSIPECPLLRTREDALMFLRTQSLYPCFMKPIHGTFGRGAFSATSLDQSGDTVSLGDGSIRSVEDIASAFEEDWTEGYIIQKLLTLHPDAAKLVGPKISSLRLVMLKVNGDYKLHRATWRLSTGSNMSDNFMAGKSGNMIAHLAPETGQITALLGNRGKNIVAQEQHPDTGVKLVGKHVPMWEQVLDYCQKAARVFPGLRLQHWDIALCTNGPMALEVNVEGGVTSHQIAGNRGFYDKDVATALKETDSDTASCTNP